MRGERGGRASLFCSFPPTLSLFSFYLSYLLLPSLPSTASFPFSPSVSILFQHCLFINKSSKKAWGLPAWGIPGYFVFSVLSLLHLVVSKKEREGFLPLATLSLSLSSPSTFKLPRVCSWSHSSIRTRKLTPRPRTSSSLISDRHRRFRRPPLLRRTLFQADALDTDDRQSLPPRPRLYALVAGLFPPLGPRPCPHFLFIRLFAGDGPERPQSPAPRGCRGSRSGDPVERA